MRKFSVLHLSDLHITNYRNSYPKLLKTLIEDIAIETQKIDSLVLVVTGDIIDKAEYGKAESCAISFFSDLKSTLGNKITRMYFTPGNHDKKRIECHDLMQGFFNGKRYCDLYDNFENGDWKILFRHQFDDYSSLLKKISEKTNIDVNTDLFYCDVFEINGCYIRINSINSALSSFNDRDYGSLHIGKFQIDKIEQEFEKKKSEKQIEGKEIDVSLTIMHHPTFWLCKEDYDEVQFSIASHDSLATDVLLRGHTHDRSLESYYSLYNSYSTLVTGIGSSTETEKNHPQRYSIYTFMCDLNLIEIVMKASSEKGFIPDYSAYVSETDESRKKIHFPIHVHDFFSDVYLKLPLVESDFQPIYPTKRILRNMSAYNRMLLELKGKLTTSLISYKNDFITHLIENEDDLSIEGHERILEMEEYLLKQGDVEFVFTSQEFIDGILKKYSKKILSLVEGLLYEACLTITEVFFKDRLDENEQVRVQFRVFNASSMSHEGLTNHSLIGKEAVAAIGITPVHWGDGLIKKSFQKKIPLIFSLNQECITDRMNDTVWIDYLTYAPNIASNSYYCKNTKETCPAITFGINSNCKDSYTFFETLSLLPIQAVVDEFLLDIYSSFKFSFESLIRKNNIKKA